MATPNETVGNNTIMYKYWPKAKDDYLQQGYHDNQPRHSVLMHTGGRRKTGHSFWGTYFAIIYQIGLFGFSITKKYEESSTVAKLIFTAIYCP